MCGEARIRARRVCAGGCTARRTGGSLFYAKILEEHVGGLKSRRCRCSFPRHAGGGAAGGAAERVLLVAKRA